MKQEEPEPDILGLGLGFEGVAVGEENGFVNEIIKSMLTPGYIGDSLKLSIHISLSFLILIFILLYIVTQSIHCLILIGTSLCLWASCFFVLNELDLMEEEEKLSKSNLALPAVR